MGVAGRARAEAGWAEVEPCCGPDLGSEEAPDGVVVPGVRWLGCPVVDCATAALVSEARRIRDAGAWCMVLLSAEPGGIRWHRGRGRAVGGLVQDDVELEDEACEGVAFWDLVEFFALGGPAVDGVEEGA